MKAIKLRDFGQGIVLLIILALALFLYFHRLDEIPNGFYVDEAAVGYNAYSIMLTGKDEYGKSFPIAFRLLGSYSPPLYIYAIIPFIRLFDLNIFSVRFLSAISGVMNILIVFLFLKSFRSIKSELTPFLAAFLFLLMPWNVFYSRLGYEVNFAFMLFALGALLVWYGLIKKPICFVFGFLSLSLSMFAAHTERFLVPLFALSFFIGFRNYLFDRKNRAYSLAGLVLSGLILWPHLLIIKTPAFWGKGSLFYHQAVKNQVAEVFPFLPEIIAWPLALIREFTSQFLTYFSPRSLFFSPDPDPQRSLPALSVFYPWLVVFYFLGIFLLLKMKPKQERRYLWLLILTAPIPAALTGDPFSTQRALPFLLPLFLIISLGIDKVIKKIPLVVSLLIFGFLSILSLVLLWRSYFVLLPRERAKVWGYGFQELAKEIKKRPETSFVIDQARNKPAYIELAFFLKYPPEKFQEETKKISVRDYYFRPDFDPDYQFGNLEIRPLRLAEDIHKDQLLVGDSLAISENQAKEYFLTKIFEIHEPISQIANAGEVIFQGFKTNSKVFQK